jgi:hypothetical protein
MNALALRARSAHGPYARRSEAEDLALLLPALEQLLHTSATTRQELHRLVLAHALTELDARWPDADRLVDDLLRYADPVTRSARDRHPG